MELPDTMLWEGTTMPEPSAAVSTRILVAADVEIVNEILTAEVNPELDAVKFFDPTRLILRSLKVATPDAFVNCVVVPDKTPVPDESDINTDVPDVRTLLPKLSRN